MMFFSLTVIIYRYASWVFNLFNIPMSIMPKVNIIDLCFYESIPFAMKVSLHLQVFVFPLYLTTQTIDKNLGT